MPVFFLLFRLVVEYDVSGKRGRVRVIKVMDEQGRSNGSAAFRQEEGMLLKRLVLTLPDDTVKEIRPGRLQGGAGSKLRLCTLRPV